MERVGVRETFGLTPVRKGLRQMRKAIVGSGDMPASHFGLSSVKIFKPRISFATWLRQQPWVRDVPPRRAPIYNLFNRRCPPPGSVHSVLVTDVEDFRGGAFTYDNHIGVDFAVPVGTTITASAPGRVVVVRRELDRGGLKVIIDHGHGLITCSNHNARALVAEGDAVTRGQPIALSGASGVEEILLFPWIAPHLHFTVLLNGIPVDPFARPDEVCLWRVRNDPAPFEGDAEAEPEAPCADFDEARVDAAIAVCTSTALRARLESLADPYERFIETVLAHHYQGPLFSEILPLYATEHPRQPHLDLPLSADDYDGCFIPEPAESSARAARRRVRSSR